MQTIAFVSNKGGSGKTTLGANIAVVGAAQELKIAIIDLDPQGGISDWCLVRNRDDIELIVTNPRTLEKDIARKKQQGYDLLIIDTPCQNISIATSCIKLADITVVPVRPASVDWVSVRDTLELLARSAGRGGAVINAIIPNTKVADDVAVLIKKYKITLLARINQRMAIQHAFSKGQGAVEYEGRGQAAVEIIDLWNAIQEQLA